MQENKTVTGDFKCVNRTAHRAAPQPEREQSEGKRFFGIKRRTFINTAVCAFLALGIWGLSAIDSDITNRITGKVYEASTSELLQDEELGQLKFVNSDGSVMPVEGEVVTTFSDSKKQVEISGEPMAQVRAVLSGTVAAVEEDRITVQNDNGTRSTYTGISAGVSAGEYVERSQVIGTLSDEVLALETVSGTGYLDSMSARELEETMD